jgi:hypothetical protein
MAAEIWGFTVGHDHSFENSSWSLSDVALSIINDSKYIYDINLMKFSQIPHCRPSMVQTAKQKHQSSQCLPPQIQVTDLIHGQHWPWFHQGLRGLLQHSTYIAER